MTTTLVKQPLLAAITRRKVGLALIIKAAIDRQLLISVKTS